MSYFAWFYIIIFCLFSSPIDAEEIPLADDCELYSGATEEIEIPVPGARERLTVHMSARSYRPLFGESAGRYTKLDYGYRLLQSIHHARIQPRRILLLGTGSGWDAIWLAKRFTQSAIVATDIVRDSVLLARFNAKINGVADRIQYRVADLFDGIEGSFDLIVFNAPRALLDPETSQALYWDYARYTSAEQARQNAQLSYESMLEKSLSRPDLFDSQGFLLTRFLKGAVERLSLNGKIFVMSNKVVPTRFVPAGLTGRRVSALFDWRSTLRIDENRHDAFAIHEFTRMP